MSAKLQATKNYDLFELTPFNRDLEKLTKLLASMKTHGWIDAYPMHVIKNGQSKLKIKAGHHRFVVGKQLAIAVKYVVCSDEATIFELEEAGPGRWKLCHYLQSFCRIGSPEHIAVKEYMDRTGIPVTLSISLLAGSTATSANHNAKFKQGTYQIGNTSHAEAVADLVLECRRLGISFASSNLFVQALSRCLRVPEFDSKTFLQRVEVNLGSMIAQPSLDDFMTLIEDINNRRSHRKLPLKFLADETLRTLKPIGLRS